MATAKYSPVKLLIVSSIFTLFFCLAIGFDVTPFLRGPAPYPPEWRWVYDFTNTLGKIWAPILIGVMALLGLFYFDREAQEGKNLSWIFLPFIFLFTIFLQLSILFYSRGGIGVLLERIINPGINGYFTTALSIQNIGSFLSTFQSQVANFPMRAADHPPFAILFFTLILFISHSFAFLFPFVTKISLHHRDIEILWSNLLPYQKLGAIISIIIIPLLSAGVTIPLYFFVKLYRDKKTAIRACFLYCVFPSLYLFLPLNDAFLGLFTMVGFIFLLIGEKKNRFFSFFFSGLSFALGTFFSVSLLVPIVMVILMLLLAKTTRQEKTKGISWLIGGLVILPIALALFFHFNTVAVFVELTKLQARRSYLPWVFYDLYDFFIFSGIPVLVSSIFLIKQQISRKSSVNLFVASFFITLLLLDISGVSRAETGRIWMPYMPLIAAIVAIFLTKEKKLSTRAFAWIIILQLIQLLVMQEFWVTLW